MKSLIMFVVAIFVSTGMTIGSSFAAAPSPQPPLPHARLAGQHNDTLENIADYGYTFDKGQNKHTLTFNLSTVDHILHEDFDHKLPKGTALFGESTAEKTRRIKKFLKDVVDKTISMFSNPDPLVQKGLFSSALSKSGLIITVAGKDLKTDPGTVNAAAKMLYEHLQANLEAARTPVKPAAEMGAPEPLVVTGGAVGGMGTPPAHLDFTPENLIHHFIDRFKDGVKEYPGEDTDYSDIQEVTEADLNKAHERPDFKTFLRYLKSLGIVPLNPKAFRTLFLPEAAEVHERAEERVEGARGLFDDDD